MKIYVIRHGRTNTNEKGLLNGLFNEDINNVSISQAINTYFNGIPNDLIILNAKTQKNCEIVEYEVNKFNN